MTKQKFWAGQRVQYAGKVVEVIGEVGDTWKTWRLKVRDADGVEMLAHPTLVKPTGTPSARRGRVYLGQIVEELKQSIKEAKELEERILS